MTLAMNHDDTPRAPESAVAPCSLIDDEQRELAGWYEARQWRLRGATITAWANDCGAHVDVDAFEARGAPREWDGNGDDRVLIQLDEASTERGLARLLIEARRLAHRTRPRHRRQTGELRVVNPPPPPPEKGPRRIEVNVETARMVDQAIEALRDDDQIFVHGGALRRVVHADGTERERIARDTGSPVMRVPSASWIQDRLSIHSRFYKVKTRRSGEVVELEEEPPLAIAAKVLERGTWPDYRRLTGVVTSPTMRRDGSVLQEPGYDERSGLLFLPATHYPPVPGVPSWSDARAACARLYSVVDDFPFDALGRAAWLALLLTLVARELVDGATPLFAYDAPTAGTGKGLAVRVPHLIAFGREIPHMSLPPTDEEARKQFTTTLLAGDPAVLLDNISQPLGGDSLDALITAPAWQVRLLGKNENSGAITPRVVLVATGNGLEFVGDLARRTLRNRLESPHERPEERADYRHPERAGEARLVAWVHAHRDELVVDALTMLRAWHVAGRPGRVKDWGSFTGWTETIAKCVQWVTEIDPTLARATGDAALDPGKRALQVVYDAIRRLGGKDGCTAGAIVRAAFPGPYGPADEDLVEAIEHLAPNAKTEAVRARVLGRRLKVGRIIDGLKLEAIPGAARSTRYRLVRAGGEQ